tara:strand:+ start:2263 stop:2703 length:441 start_codon:yes stop_codon:yes gene_type:complete
MAFIDTSITGSFIEDRDQNIFIGIDLPFYNSSGPEGYFASTVTTLAAVKNNIRNLIQTERGERFMQPNIGINLRSYLFEQKTHDLPTRIEEDIMSTISYWLPFVIIRSINVDVDGTSGDERNGLKIDITFSINKSPNTLDSIQIEI